MKYVCNCDISNCGSDDPDDGDYDPTFNVETECPRELLRDGCAGNFCNEPYDVLTWYSDMDKDFNVIQQGSGRTSFRHCLYRCRYWCDLRRRFDHALCVLGANGSGLRVYYMGSSD